MALAILIPYERGTTVEEDIKVILESNFTETKPEIIDRAHKSIMSLPIFDRDSNPYFEGYSQGYSDGYRDGVENRNKQLTEDKSSGDKEVLHDLLCELADAIPDYGEHQTYYDEMLDNIMKLFKTGGGE